MTEEKATTLTDVDPQAIQLLFDKEPLQITDQDFQAMVDYFRSQRHKYLAEEGKGKKGRPAGANIDLSQLDIEI